ncbi:MAG: amidohydrolase family protein [Oscillospiraceae bacterium]|nr:amidohydrolase family protein [Oscillospiraceae bacterium]
MLAFVNARLIDGTGAAARDGYSVLTDGKTISAVGRNIRIPKNAEIINLRGKILMPGLIEAHAHIGEHPLYDGAGLDSAEQSHEYEKMRKYALEAGITTIRSCGDYMYDSAEVSRRINNGIIQGPRIICSGKSFMRNDAHPATTVWAANPATVANCGAYPKTCSEARSMVKEAVDAGMDFIKIIIGDTHIILWPKKFNQLENDIIKTIIEEAHRYGRPVACHVDHLEQAEFAVEYGADEIHHLIAIGTPDHELGEYVPLFEAMCRKNVWLVPTIAVPRLFESRRLEKRCPSGGIDECIKVFKMAYEFGVPLGLGCDAGCPGIVWGKSLWNEMREYVYNVGMTPLEAIRCATSQNARMMRMETQIGSIRVGACADLLVLDKDPSMCIDNIDSILLVIRDGTITVDNRCS